MPTNGYASSGEQSGPHQLIDEAKRAEAAGFDVLSISNHVMSGYRPERRATRRSPNRMVRRKATTAPDNQNTLDG